MPSSGLPLRQRGPLLISLGFAFGFAFTEYFGAAGWFLAYGF
ncbi:MAG: hypothetical protein ACOZDY_08165 [Pseudomonadota bacterium]